MGIFGTKKELLGTGGAGDVTLASIGGEIKGKGFRERKRAARQMARANRKAQRKVDKFGGSIEDYGGQKLTRMQQREADYFKDLRKERAKDIAATTAIAAAGVATAGLGVAAAQAGGVGAAISGAGGLGSAIGSGLGTIGSAAGSALGIGGGAGTGTGAGFLGKEGVKRLGKQALKAGIKRAVAGSGGAQGAFNVDPTQQAQFEQQMQQMQMGPMMFAPPQQYQQPPMPTQNYQPPGFVGPPEYTASSVYDPFAYNE